MNMESHLNALTEKHTALEGSIHKEAQRPFPDQLKINTMKKQKLRIKEEIEQLTH